MEIFDLLTTENRKDYKCYLELKRLLIQNKDFKQTIIKGFQEGKIKGFTEELWNKINSQNIRTVDNFEDVFREGANIGYCTVASKQLSYSLDTCYICGGVLPILKGTFNCEDGSHTWILYNNEIIDTTLMLIIGKEYIEKIGYIEENRYNPNLNPVYLAAKDYTNDKELKKTQN